jgi:hypothetical protein
MPRCLENKKPALNQSGQSCRVDIVLREAGPKYGAACFDFQLHGLIHKLPVIAVINYFANDLD